MGKRAVEHESVAVDVMMIEHPHSSKSLPPGLIALAKPKTAHESLSAVGFGKKKQEIIEKTPF